MTPDHLSRLKAAGVWPEGFYYEPHTKAFVYTQVQHVESLPERFARSALIDAMLDALPDDAYLQKDWNDWDVKCPDPNPVRQYELPPKLLATNKDKFTSLFDALVVSGRIKP